MTRYLKIGAILVIGLILGYRAVHAVGRFVNEVRPDPAVGGAALLSGFESPAELARWETNGASLEQSTLYATEGRYAAKMTWQAGTEAPTVKLVKAFRAKQLPRDWSTSSQLAFDVFNPSSDDQRLLIQLKDQEEYRFKHVVRIPATQSKAVSIPMAVMAGAIDLKHIVHLNLFQWQPEKEVTLFVDNVRLVPLPSGAASPAVSATQHAEEPQSLEGIDKGLVEAERLTARAFASRLTAWTQADGTVRVPLSVQEPTGAARRGWLATGGVPFAPGQVASVSQIRLVDERGARLPAQLRTLATWHDGSIKWLLVSLQTDTQPHARRTVFLEYGNRVAGGEPSTALRVTEDADAVTVDTGPLRFSVSKKRFALFDAVWVDENRDGQLAEDERVANPGGFRLAHRGEVYDSRNDTQTYQVEIEERGPLSVTLKASGWFRDAQGEGFGKFIVRLQAFQGQRSVRLLPTFIYTGFPANRYHFKYEGLQLPENETIEDIRLVFAPALSGPVTVRLGDEGGLFEGPLLGPLTLLQRAHDAYELRSENEAPRAGRRASGWIELHDGRRGMMVAVRDFWQQFPKAFNADPNGSSIEVALWPNAAGELDLQTTAAAFGPDAVARGSAFGLGKTHELMVDFHEAGASTVDLHRFAEAFQEPLHLRPSAEWVNDTGVLGRLAANDTDRQLQDEVMLDRLFEWARRQPERYGWYGMLDFGDTLTSYRKESYDKSYDSWGWHPEGRWGWFNCEAVGTHTGALLQYLRTGKWKYFQFGEDLARHIMDVDTVHHNTIANDPRLAAVMDDEYSRVGSMHRHNADHWGGRNEEASHTNAVGIVLYYYLTGDPRAHDVALEVGDFFLGEHITYSGHPDIAPQRTLANVLWGDVWLYELTHDEAYLRGTVKWARTLIDGQQENGLWLDTYDPLTSTWKGEESHAYMTYYTLPALIAYHRLTNDPKAAEAVIKGTEYLMHHETFYPFFDALAYSFDLTGDARFLAEGEARVAALVGKQDRSGDPERDGVISEKLTYGRVTPFLYNVPFLFDPLERRVASRLLRAPHE